MNKNSQKVIAWRQRQKKFAVECFQNKCGICGYNTCIQALEFHHLDPKEKEFSISGSCLGIEKLKDELKKCICVCANCHREIHENLVVLDPEQLIRFQEPNQSTHNDLPKCPICQTTCKRFNQTYCSRTCSGKNASRVEYPDNLQDLVNEHGYSKTGRMFGVSDSAIRKRLQKVEIFQS